MSTATSTLTGEPATDHTGTVTFDNEVAALAHLYAVHRPLLLPRITHLTRGDVHWAEDILQETFLRAWRNPQSRTSDGRWSRGWLYTVAKRILIDNVRALQARPREFPDERIGSLPAGRGDDVGRLLDRQVVRAAIADLPDYQREILVQLYFCDRSIEDAAKVLDVPPGTVKSRTFYAMKALRTRLFEMGMLPEPRAAQ
jgi:RNA polymerase sigma-70 factor, ECF subfamily